MYTSNSKWTNLPWHGEVSSPWKHHKDGLLRGFQALLGLVVNVSLYSDESTPLPVEISLRQYIIIIYNINTTITSVQFRDAHCLKKLLLFRCQSYFTTRNVKVPALFLYSNLNFVKILCAMNHVGWKIVNRRAKLAHG